MKITLNREMIRRKRKSMKLSQERLAEMLDISDRHLRTIESEDVDIHVPLLYMLSQVFEAPMESFLIIETDG